MNPLPEVQANLVFVPGMSREVLLASRALCSGLFECLNIASGDGVSPSLVALT